MQSTDVQATSEKDARIASLAELQEAFQQSDQATINRLSTEWSPTPHLYWVDHGTATIPSCANICWKAAGKKVVRFNGIFMLEERAAEMRKKWTTLGKPLPDDDLDIETAVKQIKDRTFKELKDKEREHADARLIKWADPKPFPPKGPFDFFALPFELRTHFFEVIVGQPIIPVRSAGGWNLLNPAVPLNPELTANGNHQLRTEALLLAVKRSTWEIYSAIGNMRLQQWLDTLDFSDVTPNLITGFDAVQHLSFPSFSRFPHRTLSFTAVNEDITFMLACKNLKVVSMLWDSQDVHGYVVNQLRIMYRLDKMLELTRLRELRICTRHIFDVSMSVVMDLARWFRGAFAERFMQVDVTIDGMSLEDREEYDASWRGL